MWEDTSTHYDDRARQVALAVQQATGIERILLFGSRARGDYGADSDIDLLVVHPQDPKIAAACFQTAQQAAQRLYGDFVSTDVVLISPSLFATMQFGLNHIAAKAVKDGVTPMGYDYHPPLGENPSHDPLQLEAMERAFHARLEFSGLHVLMQEGALDFYTSQEAYDVAFGKAAQGTLEHALKALVVSRGKEYSLIHDLVRLEAIVRETVPEFHGLQSPAAILSGFAGGAIYATPDLERDIEELFDLIQSDLSSIFSLIHLVSKFDPWTVQKSDFRL